MKLLTLITFCLFATFTNAQDASNDATWEETVNFIKKHKNSIDVFKYSGGAVSSEFYIDNNKLILKIKYSRGHTIKSSFELINLLDVTSSIKLELVGNVLKMEIAERGSNSFKDFKSDIGLDELRFKVDNIELQPRIKKAFQHLAYLATEKRKEIRNNSGDKF
jgi:hypothetical protein